MNDLEFIKLKTAAIKEDAKKHTRIYSQDALILIQFIEELLAKIETDK